MKEELEAESSPELTSDQQYAIKTFDLWLKSSSIQEPFVLSGFAGSGKTFLSMKIIKIAEKKNIFWTVAAPTHKAVGVLRKALDSEGIISTWHPSTIHRLLRLKLKRKGDIEFCEKTEHTQNSLEPLGLVLIDESSMIDDNLLEIILTCAHPFQTRLVFVGDPAQLPPVGEPLSSVFSMQRATNVQLKEVVRHQGPVLSLASQIRDGRIECTPPPCIPTVQSANGLVACLQQDNWLEQAKIQLKLASEKKNPDGVRILCYTNRMLERLVPHARRAIHGEMANELPVLPGEILISRKAIMAPASVDGNDVGEEPDLLISSNREMVVLDVTPECCKLSNFVSSQIIDWNMPTIDTLVAEVKCGELIFSLRIQPQIGTNSRKNLDMVLKKLSNLAKGSADKERKLFWKTFFYLRDSFASLGPASVLTVHRSQGSTFEDVFVASDVFWPKDLTLRKQLVYVAITRASKSVWMVGENNENIANNLWAENLF